MLRPTDDVRLVPEEPESLSAAYNPHSNCRAEIAVKAGKRLLRDNVGYNGTLDTDKVMRAVLQFTPWLKTAILFLLVKFPADVTEVLGLRCFC